MQHFFRYTLDGDPHLNMKLIYAGLVIAIIIAYRFRKNDKRCPLKPKNFKGLMMFSRTVVLKDRALRHDVFSYTLRGLIVATFLISQCNNMRRF